MNDNIYAVSPQATDQAIKNTLNEKITQTKAIINCIMLATNELDGSLLYDVIWAVDSNLEEIDKLQERLNNPKCMVS